MQFQRNHDISSEMEKLRENQSMNIFFSTLNQKAIEKSVSERKVGLQYNMKINLHIIIKKHFTTYWKADANFKMKRI